MSEAMTFSQYNQGDSWWLLTSDQDCSNKNCWIQAEYWWWCLLVNCRNENEYHFFKDYQCMYYWKDGSSIILNRPHQCVNEQIKRNTLCKCWWYVHCWSELMVITDRWSHSVQLLQLLQSLSGGNAVTKDISFHIYCP